MKPLEKSEVYTNNAGLKKWSKKNHTVLRNIPVSKIASMLNRVVLQLSLPYFEKLTVALPDVVMTPKVLAIVILPKTSTKSHWLLT